MRSTKAKPKARSKCPALGCPRKVKVGGYCTKHYRQMRVHGRLTPELEHKRQGPRCLKCKEPPMAKGYCPRHYRQIYRFGYLFPPEREYEKHGTLCEAKDCGERQIAKGLCPRHYKQVHTHGRLTPELERTPEKISQRHRRSHHNRR